MVKVKNDGFLWMFAKKMESDMVSIKQKSVMSIPDEAKGWLIRANDGTSPMINSKGSVFIQG